MSQYLPYTVTALARITEQDGKNVVTGAVIRVFADNVQQLIYEDADGLNPSMEKQSDINGLRTIFLPSGVYELDVNGRRTGFGVGDTALRFDIRPLASVKNLSPVGGVSQVVQSFWTGLNLGGGVYVYEPDRAATQHNGVTIIAHSKLSSLSDVTDTSPFGDYFTAPASGGGCYVRQDVGNTLIPEWAGAVRSSLVNQFDCYLPIDKCLSLSSYATVLGLGDWWVSDTLRVRFRGRFWGLNSAWSPSSNNRVSALYWLGGTGKAMLQCADQPFLTESVNPIVGVNVGDLYLDGNNVADVGFYGAAMRDDSVLGGAIVVRRCNLFGHLLEGDTYYLTINELIASDCNGMGIAMGYNYNNVFADDRFNSVKIKYLRTSRCGQGYNVSTAPTGYSEVTAPKNGSMYLRLKAGSKVDHIISENGYGPGLVIHPSDRSRAQFGSIYLERNGSDALAAGDAAVKYEGVLYDEASTSAATVIDGLWLETLADQNLKYVRVGSTPSEFIIKNTGSLIVHSDETGELPIHVIRHRGSLEVANNNTYWLKNRSGYNRASRYRAESRHGMVTNASFGGVAEIMAMPEYRGWVSGTKIKLAEVTMISGSNRRSSVATLMLNIQAHASNTSPETQVRNKLYSLSLVNAHRFTNATGYQNLVELQSHNANNISGGNILEDFTPTVEFETTATRVIARIYVEITSTGLVNDNSVTGAIQMLGGGNRGGNPPTVTTEFGAL